MLSDWVQVVKHPLLIWHRPGDERWAELAVAYWTGELAGLVPAPSSKHARVHRRDDLYFKRYMLRDWRDVVKHAFRPSRARRALLRGEELAAAGILAPRAVCLIEERRLGVVRGSALVAEAIDEAPNLRDWLNRPDLGLASNRAGKRELLGAFAREVARWHVAGFHHADMRIGNILCKRGGAGWSFTWLDNEGNTRHRNLPASERIHNLMQVNMERTGVTMTDRLHFWNVYLDSAGISPAEERALQRAVVDYTRKRWMKRGWL